VREELPRGTVTFLFTDVEGSTKLLHELGSERYADALAEHRRAIREACTREGGVEVDTQGDAFFFAFPTASGALAAARAATDALAAGRVQVRTGVHTGTPLVTDEGYVGDDVHLAARVAASGHGGQVLVSAAAAAYIEPSGSESQALPLLDLGEHRLKDIAEPVVIYQLGEGSFPPLKTISNTNLPRPASSFVGREHELREVLGRVGRGARLVTLTGPGGSGKTRLALEAAGSLVPEYKAGVFWVGLSALRDPALVTETIAQTLGSKDGLADHVGEREMLLLLDNLEQVIEAAPELSALLERCPNLTLLVTSRALLRVQGEVEYPVPPLAQPEAVALFCERAQLAPSEEIAELCARLDSLPLAVELAAARTKALSPAQILERLSQRLDLLKGGRDADPRQQTLRATIEWSYDLLTPAEQRLFARFSVFAGGCILEAAELVCEADLDTLQSLVEKSLLRFSEERYWMLETVREYAAERLEESPEHESLRNRHLECVASSAFAQSGPARQYDSDAFALLRAEQPNIREALAWALETQEAESAQRIFAGTWFYWLTHGLAREGDAWAMRVAAMPSEPSEHYAWTLTTAGEFPRFRGDPERALSLKEHGIAVLQQLEQTRSVISRLAAALSDTSDVLAQLGDFDRARDYAERALAMRRENRDPHGVAHALEALALLAERQQTPSEALALYEESVSLYEASGDPMEASFSLIGVSRARLALDDVRGARSAAEEALHRSTEGDEAYARVNAGAMLGIVANAEGDFERAVGLLAQAQAESEAGGVLLDDDSEVTAALRVCQETLGEERYQAAINAAIGAAAPAGS
jgi:predicted ATPase/class 3 adenylate cyclase